MNLKSLSPSEAIIAWNNSLVDGDLETARALTASAAFEYIEETWGSVSELSNFFRDNLKTRPEQKVIYEEQTGNEAVVVCRVEYRHEATKIWMDRAIREDSQWKMDPRAVQMMPLASEE